jgi:signal transduction histidine kinase
MIEKHGNYPFLLSTTPPDRKQQQLAGGVLAFLVAALLITAPFAHIRPAGTEIFLPAYATAVLLVELLTSALLLALFSVQNSRAVLILSAGYFFSGLLVIPWVLTFPGVFTAFGFDPNIQSTAAIAAVRRLSFPLFVLAYALMKDRQVSVRKPQGSIRAVIAGELTLVAGLAFGFALIVARADELPTFMTDTRNVTPLWRHVSAAAIGLYLTGLISLWVRRRSTLDLWLMVVLCTLLIEIILLSYLGGGTRLGVGWWAGRLYGLASASMVLLVLLSETMTLQARLARSVQSERLARESRLTAMEALSASVAHEINQPLASMVTNASAGLQWLDKEVPRIKEAQAALKRVVRDGHRARDVIDGIRNLFRKDAQERVSLDLNRLIKDVLQRSEEEARFSRVSIEADLDEKLPLTTGNALQLHQVVSNLVGNAVDAISAVTDRSRVVRVTSEPKEPGEILVSVEDSGTGIDPSNKDRIFEPFFSTKRDGMGMGLMFSRSIIEDHGGKLWATDNIPHGAIFHFTLPGSDQSAALNTELTDEPGPIRCLYRRR